MEKKQIKNKNEGLPLETEDHIDDTKNYNVTPSRS